MKLWKCVGVAVVLCFVQAQAQSQQPKKADPSALAAAKDLMSLINQGVVDQMVDQMTQMSWPTFEGLLKGRKGITEKKIDSLKTAFVKIEQDYMKELMTEYPAIYARHFSADELRQLIAFYKLPIGQKSLREMPVIFGEIMPLIQAKLPKLQSDIIESFQKSLKENNIDI